MNPQPTLRPAMARFTCHAFTDLEVLRPSLLGHIIRMTVKAEACLLRICNPKIVRNALATLTGQNRIGFRMLIMIGPGNRLIL